MKRVFVLLAILCVAIPSYATTTNPSPNVYKVDAGVEFQIGNDGTSSFLFNWSDTTSGDFANIADPTLILSAEETYIFRRTTGVHPLALTDNSLPVTGTDGTYSRTTSDGAAIDAATLSPLDAFTAEPTPAIDSIIWTPATGDIGDYFYTCRIPFHLGMTGRIQVVAASVPTDTESWSRIKALFQ